MRALMVILAVLTGIGLSFQAGVNSRLGQHTSTPFHAAFLNFVVGSVLLLATSLLAAPGAGLAMSRLGQAPWWTWLGGLFGAAFVAMAVKATPTLGVVLLVSCAIAGQMIGSVVIDQFGMLGLPVRTLTPGRVVGLVLVFAGVVLVLRER